MRIRQLMVVVAVIGGSMVLPGCDILDDGGTCEYICNNGGNGTRDTDDDDECDELCEDECDDQGASCSSWTFE